MMFLGLPFPLSNLGTIIAHFSYYLLMLTGIILGAVTKTIVSVVSTKIQIVQSFSSSGVVAVAVEVAARGLAEEGPGFFRAGVNLVRQLFKVGTNVLAASV